MLNKLKRDFKIVALEVGAEIKGFKQAEELAQKGITVETLASQTMGKGLDADTIRLIPVQFESGEDYKDQVFDAAHKRDGTILTNEELNRLDRARREALVSYLPRS